ncbi:hypothetical protein [Streptomyces sp. NPDC003077]|uniref:hypothetical protein n=1 Tax=Streptomyces sp. NPDC003077 TaxID=3154443 RepID=UPI0033A7079B
MKDAAEDVEAYLAEIIGEWELGMLARAVVAAEILDDAGQRTLQDLTTPAVEDWDAVGMFRCGARIVEDLANDPSGGTGDQPRGRVAWGAASCEPVYRRRFLMRCFIRRAGVPEEHC